MSKIIMFTVDSESCSIFVQRLEILATALWSQVYWNGIS